MFAIDMLISPLRKRVLSLDDSLEPSNVTTWLGNGIDIAVKDNSHGGFVFLDSSPAKVFYGLGHMLKSFDNINFRRSNALVVVSVNSSKFPFLVGSRADLSNVANHIIGYIARSYELVKDGEAENRPWVSVVPVGKTLFKNGLLKGDQATNVVALSTIYAMLVRELPPVNSVYEFNLKVGKIAGILDEVVRLGDIDLRELSKHELQDPYGKWVLHYAKFIKEVLSDVYSDNVLGAKTYEVSSPNNVQYVLRAEDIKSANDIFLLLASFTSKVLSK